MLKNLEQYIIPLYDKEWVLSTIKNKLFKELEEDYEDDDGYDEAHSELLEQIESYEIDGSIIFGKPTTPYDGESSLMLGLKCEGGYLDDQSLIDYITQEYWKELQSDNLVDLHLMESHMGVMDNIGKERNKLLSEIIAQSLLSPNAAVVKSTDDCKKVLSEQYNCSKVKRISKHKWNNIEYRLFHDENDNEFSIVTYNGKLISHYKLAYVEE